MQKESRSATPADSTWNSTGWDRLKKTIIYSVCSVISLLHPLAMQMYSFCAKNSVVTLCKQQMESENDLRVSALVFRFLVLWPWRKREFRPANANQKTPKRPNLVSADLLTRISSQNLLDEDQIMSVESVIVTFDLCVICRVIWGSDAVQCYELQTHRRTAAHKDGAGHGIILHTP